MTAAASASSTGTLANWWMPFTHNRYFRSHPKVIASAAGAYYTLEDGRRVFDCLSGLWCSPLGHSHPAIVSAVQQQVATLDYSPSFQLGNRPAFELATQIAKFASRPDDKVFFVNSGSEAVDTALKIAVAYHRARGEGQRQRIIGRERAYHGVGLGGMSVGGIPTNRRAFGPLMIAGVDHLPHTYSPEHMRFSCGQPAWGGHLANELERIVQLHDASNIAAVIVEPMQGSTGVIVPPVGYLKMLREICTKHGILLIFDEVITGFGRLGTPFAADFFDVQPDLTTFAKAVTNGVVPLGGVLVRNDIYESFMSGPEHVVELFHGYTYSGHPLAMAAGRAALDSLVKDDLISNAAKLSPVLEAVMHGLRDEELVIDVRNLGLAAALELKPIAGQPGLRAIRVFEAALDEGLLVRCSGDTIAVAPPFIATETELKDMGRGLVRALKRAV